MPSEFEGKINCLQNHMYVSAFDDIGYIFIRHWEYRQWQFQGRRPIQPWPPCSLAIDFGPLQQRN